MEPGEVEVYFKNIQEKNAEKSSSLAAIETLYEYLKRSKAETLAGLNDELNVAVNAMLNTDYSNTSVASATELFRRFITLASLDQPGDFSDCKRVLLDRGRTFIQRVSLSRDQISSVCLPFIKENSVILTHSNSRVVFATIKLAAERGRKFSVFVTEAAPDRTGYDMEQKLTQLKIPCVVILDNAVAYLMERIDFVLVGAEGVVENGGVINKIGTYSIALCAAALNKPVYVLAESVKFVKEYPLNQSDIPINFKYKSSLLKTGKDLTKEHPLVDYTPPELIRLIFSDLGVLTPHAVSDEIVNLYL